MDRPPPLIAMPLTDRGCQVTHPPLIGDENGRGEKSPPSTRAQSEREHYLHLNQLCDGDTCHLATFLSRGHRMSPYPTGRKHTMLREREEKKGSPPTRWTTEVRRERKRKEERGKEKWQASKRGPSPSMSLRRAHWLRSGGGQADGRMY